MIIVFDTFENLQKFAEGMVTLPPEFEKVINDHFWELL
jgi:hypothetical protein